MRCLEAAGSSSRSTRARSTSRRPATRSCAAPTSSEGVLDVGRWANDALVLALPAQLLCREDCAGLCAVCGESPQRRRSRRAHATTSGGDPRMAKLRDLKLD